MSRRILVAHLCLCSGDRNALPPLEIDSANCGRVSLRKCRRPMNHGRLAQPMFQPGSRRTPPVKVSFPAKCTGRFAPEGGVSVLSPLAR